MSNNKTPLQDSHRFLVKSTSLISAGTLSSRILGFLRDIILAKFLGTGLRADAFFVAFKIPNLFRDLVGEGATNAAIVPVLSEYQQKQNRQDFWEFVHVVFVIALIVLSVLTILGILCAPWIVRLIAPGFMMDPQKLQLTVRLTKMMFPYLIFIGLTAYSMGILFTFRSFLVPAFSPCLLNIALIVSALLCSRTMEEPVFGLAVGVLVGGVLQLAVHWHPLAKMGMRWHRPKTLRHAGAVKILRLLVPRILGSGVYQLTVFIDTFCASLAAVVGEGGISAIYYANRVLQFPLGVFGVAMASAVLPALSGLAQRNETESLKETLVFSLENIFFMMCPMTAALFLFSEPVIRLLFQRGEFGVYSTLITSSALSYYAIGLFSFGAAKILVTAFYALQDTKTPLKSAVICLGINTVLNFVLMFPLKIGGIALASAVAGTANFLMLLYGMDRRLGGLSADLFRYLFKVFAVSVTAGVAALGVWHSYSSGSEMMRLAAAGVAGVFIYAGLCLVLRVPQAQKIWEWGREKIRGTR